MVFPGLRISAACNVKQLGQVWKAGLDKSQWGRIEVPLATPHHGLVRGTLRACFRPRGCLGF